MKRYLVFVLLGLTFALAALPARADNAITVNSSNFTNSFPDHFTFQLNAQSTASISQVALVVQVGQCVSNRYIPDFTPGTQVQATYTWDLKKNYMPPGVSGQYWWTLQDSAGNQLETPKQSFRVDDPTHQWQNISNDQLALYWYSGTRDFAQALFDRGVQAIGTLQEGFNVKLDHQVQIFIYGSHSDLLKALSVGAQEWTGGQDFPEYSIVVIDVEPSNLDWGLGATAHELTHQVVHRAVSNGCSTLGSLSLPPLMDEGLAVYNQDPGSPDPQFEPALKRAIQNNTLIPLRTLTSSFPADPQAANLSYGESWSFVDFLIRRYGKEKLGQWLAAAKAGGYYDDLFRQVYGLDLDGLEVEWRKDIGAPPRVIPTRDASKPTPFPTFGLSTDETPTPGAANPTATSQAVAVNVTPPPAQPTSAPPSAPSNSINLSCGGALGLIVLGLVGGTKLLQMLVGIGKF
jgi:hypothetical protein